MKHEYCLCLGPLDSNADSERGGKPTFRPHYKQQVIVSNLPQHSLLPGLPRSRSYLRSLRAVEMAAWEMTGGDYLRSCFVTQT